MYKVICVVALAICLAEAGVLDDIANGIGGTFSGISNQVRNTIGGIRHNLYALTHPGQRTWNGHRPGESCNQGDGHVHGPPDQGYHYQVPIPPIGPPPPNYQFYPNFPGGRPPYNPYNNYPYYPDYVQQPDYNGKPVGGGSIDDGQPPKPVKVPAKPSPIPQTVPTTTEEVFKLDIRGDFSDENDETTRTKRDDGRVLINIPKGCPEHMRMAGNKCREIERT